MKTTTNKQGTKQDVTPGFAIKLTDTTELGLAILIAEDEEGQYEPLGCVATIGEAREIEQGDLRGRMRRLDAEPIPAFARTCIKFGPRDRKATNGSPLSC